MNKLIKKIVLNRLEKELQSYVEKSENTQKSIKRRLNLFNSGIFLNIDTVEKIAAKQVLNALRKYGKFL